MIVTGIPSALYTIIFVFAVVEDRGLLTRLDVDAVRVMISTGTLSADTASVTLSLGMESSYAG